MENGSRGDEIPSLKDLYEITREHITHEDDLVNSRLTWFLVVQTLLFTAYGVVLEVPKADGSNALQIQNLQAMIPWVGIAASILVLSSVRGARMSISHMEKFWLDQAKIMIEYFPSIVCKTTCVKCLGHAEAYLLPIVFAIAWSCIIGS